jgi:hypothetical protein
VAINFKVLKDEAALATGEPIKCKQCDGYLNKNSVVKKVEGGEENEYIWNCEFCYFKNDVRLDEEEFPQEDAINYMIEAAPEVVEEDESEKGIKGETKTKKKTDDMMLIFCVDTSGSMNTAEYSIDKVSGARRSISRMECIKQAIMG